MSLRVFSLNMEGERHLERFPAYVRGQRPDVVLLQEAPAGQLDHIARLLGMRLVEYVPMMRMRNCGRWVTVGLACYVTADIHVADAFHMSYVKEEGGLPDCFAPDYRVNRHLQEVHLVHMGVQYVLLQTHFTWSDNGIMTERQLHDFRVLQKLLAGRAGFALFGDSNTPRGTNAIWDTLAETYCDTIPGHVETTLDPVLHRAGHVHRVVDMCFTHGGYRAHNVSVHSGISDHQGISAEIERLRYPHLV